MSDRIDGVWRPYESWWAGTVPEGSWQLHACEASTDFRWSGSPRSALSGGREGTEGDDDKANAEADDFQQQEERFDQDIIDIHFTAEIDRLSCENERLNRESQRLTAQVQSFRERRSRHFVRFKSVVGWFRKVVFGG